MQCINTANTLKLPVCWQSALHSELGAPYFSTILQHVANEQQVQHTVYPPLPEIFAAFNYTPFNDVKVVILGQDPYHNKGQAHGLSFSVAQGVKLPPSLKNIFAELKTDIGLHPPTSGNLSSWALQGVLLLNATLTVRVNEPNAHSHFGWQLFTNAVIEKLSNTHKHLVFMLWGNFSQQKINLINTEKHLVLTAAHPSPFSARKGFFGCAHFSKCNTFLAQHSIEKIDWKSIEENILF